VISVGIPPALARIVVGCEAPPGGGATDEVAEGALVVVVVIPARVVAGPAETGGMNSTLGDPVAKSTSAI